MKLKRIDTLLVYAQWRNWVFVKLTADTGLVGWGEATIEGKEKTVEAAIHELGRYLIGQDPTEIERHWHHMYRMQWWNAGPVICSALSGVEHAMWDLLGKQLNTPVYRLLGGLVRDERVRVYANGWYWGADSPEEFARRALHTVQRGFTALKFDPFASGYLSLTRREADIAVERVKAVREAVGEQVQLLMEFHGRLDAASAIEVCRRLEKYDPFFIEEPTPPENLEALAKVAGALPLRFATGERLYTRNDYRRLFPLQAADFIQPDLCHVGGIGECKKIAAFAETWYVSVAPHNPNGPVGTAASCHVVSTIPNFVFLELLVEDVPWRDEVVTPAWKPVDGYLTIPDRPGLGLDVNEEVALEHPYQPVDLPSGYSANWSSGYKHQMSASK
jgi:galactonate dehydratase